MMDALLELASIADMLNTNLRENGSHFQATVDTESIKKGIQHLVAAAYVNGAKDERG